MKTDRSAALHQRALSVMPGGNTRSSVWESPHPLYVAHGAGAWVTDVDGNRLLDFTNNFTTLIHGHAQPEMIEAVARQLPLGVSFSGPTESEVELAELLCARVPGFEHVRFTNTGSEAVMMALRAARAITGRPKIAKCEGAYHGNYAPVEVSYDSSPADWGEERPAKVAYNRGTPASVLDQVVVLPFNDVITSEAILAEEAGEVAAVLLDPMPARAGLVPATAEYLRFLRQFTRRHGMLLISDEVLNFRMSAAGAITALGGEADLTAFGKIVGGGLPIGAIAGSAEAMAVFDPRRGKPPVPQAGTFTANPLSMVAGLAAMKAMTDAAFERLNALGERARAGLRAVLPDGQVTGLGSLFQIKLNRRTLRNYRDHYPSAEERDRLGRLVRHLRDAGVLISATGLGALSTPMTEADIDRLVAAARSAAGGGAP